VGECRSMVGLKRREEKGRGWVRKREKREEEMS
jgi:hypothetical protein